MAQISKFYGTQSMSHNSGEDTGVDTIAVDTAESYTTSKNN